MAAKMDMFVHCFHHDEPTARGVVQLAVDRVPGSLLSPSTPTEPAERTGRGGSRRLLTRILLRGCTAAGSDARTVGDATTVGSSCVRSLRSRLKGEVPTAGRASWPMKSISPAMPPTR